MTMLLCICWMHIEHISHTRFIRQYCTSNMCVTFKLVHYNVGIIFVVVALSNKTVYIKMLYWWGRLGNIQHFIVSKHSASLQIQVKTLLYKAKTISTASRIAIQLIWEALMQNWKVCCGLKVHISNCFWKSWTLCPVGFRGKPSWLFPEQSSKASTC